MESRMEIGLIKGSGLPIRSRARMPFNSSSKHGRRNSTEANLTLSGRFHDTLEGD